MNRVFIAAFITTVVMILVTMPWRFSIKHKVKATVYFSGSVFLFNLGFTYLLWKFNI